MEEGKNNGNSESTKVKKKFPIKSQKIKLARLDQGEYSKVIITLNRLGFKRNLQKELDSGQKSSKNEINRVFSKNGETFSFKYLPEKDILIGTLKSSEPKHKFLEKIQNTKEKSKN